MKTKTLVMMCLLLGIGLTQLSAQIPPPSNGKETGTVSYLISNVYWQPIVCNGDVVDNLEGTATWHVVYKWEKGVAVWNRQHGFEVDVHSTNPPYEQFKLSESDKGDELNGIVTWHYNLKGNYGSHYIGTSSYDWINNIWVNGRTICAGEHK